ncbi:MAG: hypothetical protein CRN43_00655 [Candidatus Nephrothrix sp. EaCA]|nr:MAG: hypothetical protein CRN43_00655 [Candidatus Nephrothrix sp. EaCA]
MKKLFLTLFVFVNGGAMAQVSYMSEVGVCLGGFNYTGDISPHYRLVNHRLGGGLIYRSTISRVISFRSSLSFGAVSAKEDPADAAAKIRNANFSRNIYEAAVGFEYHFLDWRADIHRLRFTPYVHAGLGVFALNNTVAKPTEYSNVQLSIPFGVGMKYVLSPRYYIAWEFGFRKTFFDYIDNISDGNLLYKNYRYGNPYDNDAYYFTCFSINYTFYDIICAVSPYKKNLF